MSAPPDPEKQNHWSSDLLPAIPSPPIVVERDDGRWATGLHDDGPGYESRVFAAAVAACEMQRSMGARS
jgi:hypothetical protein